LKSGRQEHSGCAVKPKRKCMEMQLLSSEIDATIDEWASASRACESHLPRSRSLSQRPASSSASSDDVAVSVSPQALTSLHPSGMRADEWIIAAAACLQRIDQGCRGHICYLLASVAIGTTSTLIGRHQHDIAQSGCRRGRRRHSRRPGQGPRAWHTRTPTQPALGSLDGPAKF